MCLAICVRSLPDLRTLHHDEVKRPLLKTSDQVKAMTERTEFDRFLDGVIVKMHEQQFFSANFRAEFTEMIGLCREIADYDLRLAKEVYFSAFWVSCTSALSAMDLVTSK
jgi:hypothetical protein